MTAPQVIAIIILATDVGISLAKDGEPRKHKYSFLTTLTSAVIWACVLYYGGFFKVAA